MNVKELIEKLQKLDPETIVVGKCIDPTNFTYINEIKSVKLGDPIDGSGSSIFGDNDNDYDDEWDYIGPKVVLIDIGNV